MCGKIYFVADEAKQHNSFIYRAYDSRERVALKVGSDENKL
jgi:hypothetical protein